MRSTFQLRAGAVASVFSCLALLLAGCRSAERPLHVVIVSIDGFASYYLDDPRADLPNLRSLAAEGSRARRMEVSFPSLTWTCHTTIVTGVSPARHGIVANNFFDRAAGADVAFIGDAVFGKDDAVRVPTIYDVVRGSGLKTAAVIWPASRGASTLDWTIPDSRDPEILRKYTTSGLAADLDAAGLPIEPLARWGWDHAYSAPRDDLYARIAVHLLEKRQPSLLLLHLITPDGVEHDHGPRTAEAYWSVRFADERIGEIRRALERPGLRGQSALIVVADHGFLPYEREVRLNVILAREGLIDLDQEKKPARRRAWAVAAGGAAGVYLLETDPAARAVSERKLAGILEAAEGVDRVIRPAEFMSLGLPDPRQDPRQADLMVTAREGYAFAGGTDGDAVTALKGQRGAHGHLPSHPRMGALFVAWGAGVRKGIVLDQVKAIDVAPTAARLLGVEMPGVEGRVLEEILE